VRFGVEGKEFLLTVIAQSVMNIFTASGFSVQFLRLYPVSTEDIQNTKSMCSRIKLQ
jgi:hypothetical protein